MFETKVFRKQMYCIEESTCDIVETLRALPTTILIQRPGNYDPFITPLSTKGPEARDTSQMAILRLRS